MFLFKRAVGGALVGILVCAGSSFAAEYQHVLKAKDMTFSWSIDGDQLAIKVSAPTTGWVGVGFNPSRKMQGADIIAGYVKDGKITIQDEFGTSPVRHQADVGQGGENNVTVIGGEEVNGVTTLEFSIPLSSKDKMDSQLDLQGDTEVLLAYGPNGDDSLQQRHIFRTEKKIVLASGAEK